MLLFSPLQLHVFVAVVAFYCRFQNKGHQHNQVGYAGVKVVLLLGVGGFVSDVSDDVVGLAVFVEFEEVVGVFVLVKVGTSVGLGLKVGTGVMVGGNDWDGRRLGRYDIDGAGVIVGLSVCKSSNPTINCGELFDSRE